MNDTPRKNPVTRIQTAIRLFVPAQLSHRRIVPMTSWHSFAAYRLQTVIVMLMAFLISAIGAQPATASLPTQPPVSSRKPTGLLVSSHPLYLITKAVTAGIETPQRLLGQRQSGHDSQLTPQNRLALRQASLWVWIGPEYESGLAAATQPMTQGEARSLQLSRLPGLLWRAPRPLDGSFGQTLPSAGSSKTTAVHDPHLWLDPANAIGIAYAIAAYRGTQYPALAQTYRANAHRFERALIQTVHALPRQSPRNYWAYHDAFQYLDRSLNLRWQGTLVRDEELPLTPQALQRVLSSPVPACLLTTHALSAGMQQRLQQTPALVLDESMSEASDYVVGWQQLAQHILDRCPAS